MNIFNNKQQVTHRKYKKPRRKTALDKTAFKLPSKTADILITRRQLLYGAAAIGAVAVAGTTYSTTIKRNASKNNIEQLDVPTNAVVSIDSFEEVPLDACMKKVGDFKLAYGTLLWSCDNNVAACLIPTDTASPLAKIGLLFLSSGSNHIVVEKAVSKDQGYEIYDVRATEHGLIWTEANIFTKTWRVYTAILDGVDMGEPMLVEEGDDQWETPTLAVSGNTAFWQVLPRLDGKHTTDNSLLKCAKFGQNTTQIAYTSQGRMACPPYSTNNYVVAVPRAATKSTSYQLTCIDAESLQVVDKLVLPASMKPLEAGYGPTGFSFALDAIYNFGNGISNLGTYIPTQKATEGEYSKIKWFSFARTPFGAPAWCSNYLIVKSTNTVCAIDLENKKCCLFGTQSGSDDYGEYLASYGSSNLVVTYANVDNNPIAGEAIFGCIVSVWACV